METSFEAIERAHSRMARKRVLQDVKTLARDTEDLLKATADDLSHSVKEARSRLVLSLTKAKATCCGTENSSATAGRAMATLAGKAVRQRPYECLGAGFILGLVVGILIGRR